MILGMKIRTNYWSFSIIFMVFVSSFLVGNCEWRQWRRDRKPSVHHSKISMDFLSPQRKPVKKMIVDIHDYYRARVVPSASNMLKMRWDRRAAKSAQKWANECLVLQHDSPEGRSVPGYGPCGQNIFIATHKVPWLFAIKTWWLEKEHFKYGAHAYNNLTTVGHYTQLVWAATHRVGCGLNTCKMRLNGKVLPYYTYICNYCPIGNFPNRLGTPYQAGKPCSDCKTHCTKKLISSNAKRSKINRLKNKKLRSKNKYLKHPSSVAGCPITDFNS